MATSARGAATDPTENWRLTPPDGGAPVVVDSVTVGQGVHTPGETVPFAGAFRHRPGEESGGYLDRFNSLLAFERVAGAYATGVDMKNRPWYREQHHAPALTALVGVTPPDGLAERGALRGWWGLVKSVENTTNTPQTRRALSLTTDYLADLDDYASAADVTAALEANGL